MRNLHFFIISHLLTMLLMSSAYSQQEGYSPIENQEKFLDELAGFNRGTNTL